MKVEQSINFKQSGLAQASNAPLNSILISLLCLNFKSSKIAKMLARNRQRKKLDERRERGRQTDRKDKIDGNRRSE